MDIPRLKRNARSGQVAPGRGDMRPGEQVRAAGDRRVGAEVRRADQSADRSVDLPQHGLDRGRQVHGPEVGRTSGAVKVIDSDRFGFVVIDYQGHVRVILISDLNRPVADVDDIVFGDNRDVDADRLAYSSGNRKSLNVDFSDHCIAELQWRLQLRSGWQNVGLEETGQVVRHLLVSGPELGPTFFQGGDQIRPLLLPVRRGDILHRVLHRSGRRVRGRSTLPLWTSRRRPWGRPIRLRSWRGFAFLRAGLEGPRIAAFLRGIQGRVEVFRLAWLVARLQPEQRVEVLGVFRLRPSGDSFPAEQVEMLQPGQLGLGRLELLLQLLGLWVALVGWLGGLQLIAFLSDQPPVSPFRFQGLRQVLHSALRSSTRLWVSSAINSPFYLPALILGLGQLGRRLAVCCSVFRSWVRADFQLV